VIVGVSTETEKKAFEAYYGPDSPRGGAKGLQAVLLDLSEPSHIHGVVQRLEELLAGTGRPLVALLHNTQLGNTCGQDIPRLEDVVILFFSIHLIHICLYYTLHYTL
jgi:hypothetical protein